ncbi:MULTISPECIES: GTPase Era [unclassified Campylobacter]|uniref:GTPase Era n=1 Tax=unclassified Campylobacter TaxID=2593542 RepID=UPI001D67A131|nr:GTPase Era [Campylobacter sp. RM9331]MBZ8006202.1 GTPase Era [Campylobacter sp. RM9332]
MKSGFVSVIGRTNAGKSTMINSLLGENICLVSHKENATRRKMNVVIMHDENQIILIDTPGLHESNKNFNQLLIEAAKKSLDECDLIVFVMSIFDSLDEYKKFLDLKPKVEHIVVINKVDLVEPKKLLDKLEEFNKLDIVPNIIPYSSKSKFYKNKLLDEMVKYLPEHPYFFDPEFSTDKTTKDVIKELIIESIYQNLSDELPYCCEVLINKIIEKDNFLTIYADIITDSENHKAMLIGRNANTIKRIGIVARKRIAEVFLLKINLKLVAKVQKKWYDNENFLKKVGLKQ